jgi:hypothetical protein
MEKLVGKVEKQTTASLKDMAAQLVNDMRDGTDLVFSVVLDALMARLPEAEFVAFCEKLEG